MATARQKRRPPQAGCAPGIRLISYESLIGYFNELS